MWLIDGSILKATYLNGRYGVDCLEVLRAPTVNAIPVEWITDWLTKQSIPATSYGLDCSAVEKMLDDWEKENERQTDMAE